ncbi:hypothetical protein HK407_07g11890 [Ordospora pajunii]|uniref:uncharacterized protein n=1 Tax=Ordospora pajunii TaxID=3039483 RepID=UPI0029527962|nr:uncharacterized protein HK407_07g11890 [Ordospora pajunii]KAH9411197.1 hypothetical protein HK407_07g11890 [Ordospora pajunii]
MDVRKINEIKHALFFAITVCILLYTVMILFDYAVLNARKRIFEENLGRYRGFQEAGRAEPSFWMFDYFRYVWRFVRCLIFKGLADDLPYKNAKEKLYFLEEMLYDLKMIIISAKLAEKTYFPAGNAINQLLGMNLSELHQDDAVEHNMVYKRFIALIPEGFENVQLELRVFGNEKKMSLHTHVVLVMMQYLHQK